MAGGTQSISIVIPTRNAGRAFGTALHRIMGQGRPALEILVVDQGSVDGTRHIAEQFPDARFVEAPGLAGGPRLWNRGCQEAKGDLVIFLSQDAVPADGDWLHHLTEPFSDPAVGAAYGRQRTNEDKDPINAFRLSRRFPEDAQWRRARFGDPVTLHTLRFSIANAALRRSVWQGIRFNEHLPVGADLEWARQVLLASFTVAYVPSATVERTPDRALRSVFHESVLSGWTDAYHDPTAGTVRADATRFTQSAAWHLLRHWRWAEVPALALEDAAHRYGYRLGRRLYRMGPSVRARFAPEIEHELPRWEATESDRAA
ncbi:MAG TPA: glycosyltransferase family A protein [Candidatus Limnocylindrales bacterium]|nr:glycosyltransferase family A protein [Candidatus Limnocylindrales bacterium]